MPRPLVLVYRRRISKMFCQLTYHRRMFRSSRVRSIDLTLSPSDVVTRWPESKRARARNSVHTCTRRYARLSSLSSLNLRTFTLAERSYKNIHCGFVGVLYFRLGKTWRGRGRNKKILTSEIICGRRLFHANYFIRARNRIIRLYITFSAVLRYVAARSFLRFFTRFGVQFVEKKKRNKI